MHFTINKNMQARMRYGSPGKLKASMGSTYIRYAIVALACAAADLTLASPFGLITSSAVCIIWCLWLAIKEANSDPIRLNPIVSAQLWQVLVLGISPLYVGITGLGDPFVDFMNLVVPTYLVAIGHALMVVGSFAFYVGAKQFQPKDSTIHKPSTKPPTIALLAFAAFVGAAFYIGREYVVGVAGSAVTQLSILPLAALCLIAVNPPAVLQRSQSAHFIVIVVGCLAMIVLNATRDSKGEILLSFLPLVWWAIYRNKFAVLISSFLCAALLYILLIAPVVTRVRESVTDYGSRVVAVLDPQMLKDIAPTLQRDFASNPFVFAFQWADTTLNRLCDPIVAGLAYSFATRDGFLWGDGFEYLAVNFIPRFLWPNKPYLNRGAWFSAFLSGTDPETVTTSTAITSAGELYWNFGWPGVLVGMYIIGALLSGVWWRTAKDPRLGIFHAGAYASLLLTFAFCQEPAAGWAVGLAVTAGLFWRLTIAIRNRILSFSHGTVSSPHSTRNRRLPSIRAVKQTS